MPESAPKASETPASHARRVMVVEDDSELTNLLIAILRSQGVDSASVADGRKAFEEIRRFAPGMVILDLMLPGLAGFEVLRQLQDGETSRIPVLVITGRYTDALTSSMIRSQPNVVGFMEKPLKTDELIALTAKTLGSPS